MAVRVVYRLIWLMLQVLHTSQMTHSSHVDGIRSTLLLTTMLNDQEYLKSSLIVLYTKYKYPGLGDGTRLQTSRCVWGGSTGFDPIRTCTGSAQASQKRQL